MMPTCALDGDFQVEQDITTSRRRGAGGRWERQNHTISFHDRDLEGEARGVHYVFSLIGNTP